MGIGNACSAAIERVCFSFLFFFRMGEAHSGKRRFRLYTWRHVIWLPISPAVTSDTLRRELNCGCGYFYMRRASPERFKIQHDSNYRLGSHRNVAAPLPESLCRARLLCVSSRRTKFTRRLIGVPVERIVERIWESVGSTIRAFVAARTRSPPA